MSGLGRLTVCAAAAALLTACSLLPLAAPLGWFFEAVLIVAIQAGVGAAARRIPLARPLTVLTQAVVTLLLLTFACARGEAVLGLLPGPQAMARLGQLLTLGVQDVSQYATPAPVTPGIRLLLLGGVALIALIVDALAVTYRSAAPAGLPLLALYSVASGLGTGAAHWLWFLCAAFGYLILLMSEGRDRLSRWGRVFSGAPRSSSPAIGSAPWAGPDPAGRPVAASRSGRRIGVMALGIALAAPAVLPSMSGGLLGPDSSGLGRGGAISAVNPLVSLQNSLNQTDDREVLRYRTTAVDTTDLYLRIVTLDEFDGTSWKASERQVTDVPDQLPSPTGLASGVRTSLIRTNFAAARGYAQNYLPMPYPATQVRTGGTWRYEPVGRTLVGDRGQTTSGLQYQVDSLQVEPTAKQLEDAPAPPAAIEHEYTKLPSDLPAVVRAKALQVTHGSVNAYQEAVKLQEWFTTTGGFTYDTRVAEGTGPQAIARFLHDKRGFCVHFAFTMAAMARTLGIPARVDVGFVPGTLQSDNSWSVGLKDAHAWPELYFQGVGWTRFEPTPSRGNEPDYTRDTTAAGGGTDIPSPHLGATPQPTTGTATTPACSGLARRMSECDPGSGTALGGSGGGDGPGPGTIAAITAAVLLLLLAMVPMLWRVRLRRVRLGRDDGGTRAGGDVDREGAGSGERTLAAWRELLDTAWDYGIPPDGSETPRRACGRLVRSAGLTGAPAEAAERISAAVEQVLYAAHPLPAPGVPEDVRLIHRTLHDRASRPTRLRALLAPRCAARLVHRYQSLWSTATSRTRAALARLTSAIWTTFRPGTGA